MILGLSIGLVLMLVGILGIQWHALGVGEPEPEPTSRHLGRVEAEVTADYVAHVNTALRLVEHRAPVIPLQRKAVD